MLNGKRVLVVESQFLIALEMQRILEEADAGKTVFARSIDEAESLADRFGDYDLAIIELPFDNLGAIALAQHLLTAGIAVVAVSTDRSFRRAAAQALGTPVIEKPFTQEQLVTACLHALATTSPGQAGG